MTDVTARAREPPARRLEGAFALHWLHVAEDRALPAGRGALRGADGGLRPRPHRGAAQAGREASSMGVWLDEKPLLLGAMGCGETPALDPGLDLGPAGEPDAPGPARGLLAGHGAQRLARRGEPRDLAVPGGAAAASERTGAAADEIGQAWEAAQRVWDVRVTLSRPAPFEGGGKPSHWQAEEPLAYIDLETRQVVVNYPLLTRLGARGSLTAVLAHEIGHHVRFPHTLGEAAQLQALEKRLIPGLGHSLTNLFYDLLVNEQVGRTHAAQLAAVYRGFTSAPGAEAISPLFGFYLAVYEELWGLPGQPVRARARERSREAVPRLPGRRAPVRADVLRPGHGAAAAGLLLQPLHPLRPGPAEREPSASRWPATCPSPGPTTSTRSSAARASRRPTTPSARRARRAG